MPAKKHGAQILASIILLVFSALPAGALAYTTGAYGSGAYGACAYGTACTISVSSGTTVSLPVSPTLTGVCTIASDSVGVTTDDSNGFTLTLSSTSSSTNLTNGASTIPATSGTLASPAIISTNTWGYRIDSLGSFGSGPTTAVINASPTGASFARIKSNVELADAIASTSSVANPTVTTVVWYGLCANTSVGSGSYSTSVMYTAIAN